MTQSLAGRAGILHLLPFAGAELQSVGVGLPGLPELMFKGLYPPLYDRALDPGKWYGDYALKAPKMYFLDPGLAAWLLKARFSRGLASNLFFW